MSKPVAWGRAALTGAALLVFANACDSVLGIEEPQDRPTDGGEAGDPPSATGNTDAGGNTSFTAPEGGAGTAGTPEIPTTSDAGNSGQGGQGAQPPVPECDPDQTRCAGDNEKTPEVCDESGHWVQNDAESEGECPVLCAGGKCTECEDGETRCSVCEEGGVDCNPAQVQECVKGSWIEDAGPCANYCDDGACQTPTSCTTVTSRTTCNDRGESCCRSLLVPGGAFKRDYDPEFFTSNDFPAEISPFYLDKFEVTVGRMKPFVEAYANVDLKAGDGKSAHIPDDIGWSLGYELPADAHALTDIFKCASPTWSDQEENIRLPLNCVPFNVAYAFCIWDRGRLPTEAEWNFAAAGGAEQRSYPWGSLEVTPDHGYFFAEDHDLPTSVGLSPNGDGRWGHADLSGNVSEWVLDYFYEDYPPQICKDCLAAAPSSSRTFRGGAYTTTADNQFVEYRGGETQPFPSIGFRCARDPKQLQE